MPYWGMLCAHWRFYVLTVVTDQEVWSTDDEGGGGAVLCRGGALHSHGAARLGGVFRGRGCGGPQLCAAAGAPSRATCLCYVLAFGALHSRGA